MSESTIHARFVGDFPAPVRQAILESGVVPHHAHDLTLVWFHDPEAEHWLQRGNRSPFIAFVDTPEDRQRALAAGAVDSMVGIPAEMGARLALAARMHRLHRQEMEHQLTAEHRTASELQSTRDLLSRLIDTTPCPVMAVSPSGRVLVFNPAAEHMLGYPRDWALEHLHATEVYADTDEARRVLSAIRSSPRRLVRNVRTRLRTRKGDTIEVALNAAEVYAADGLPVATVGVFLDNREQQGLNHDLSIAIRHLTELEEQSQHLSQALSRVHRLNQPLNTVMLTIELLMLQNESDAALTVRLERVYNRLENLADTVRQLTAQHHRTLQGHQLLGPLPLPAVPE